MGTKATRRKKGKQYNQDAIAALSKKYDVTIGHIRNVLRGDRSSSELDEAITKEYKVLCDKLDRINAEKEKFITTYIMD